MRQCRVLTDLATDRNACCAYDICDLLEHLVHLVLVDVLVLIHRINHHVAGSFIWAIGVGNLLLSVSPDASSRSSWFGLALDQVPWNGHAHQHVITIIVHDVVRDWW
jgi:hypothetical protein